jgi:Domain of unknown function (DUF4397)
MKLFARRFFILLPIAGAAALSACGGSDTDDRLDVADPAVRFVHASPLAPNVTLYRDGIVQLNATNAGYKFASDYFDVGTGTSVWTVKTTLLNIVVGEESFDASRGNRFTIVALPSSSTTNSIYVIRDPYNKSLISDKAKLRIMNASFNASNVDLYLNAPGTDISAVGVNPVIAATAYKTSGPATGNDSLNIEAGTYQIVITPRGTKDVLFKGALSIEKNKDILLLTTPSSVLPGAIKTLIKIDGVAGSTELTPS